MSSRFMNRFVVGVCSASVLCLPSAVVWAGHGNNNNFQNNRAVGGISIAADGVLSATTIDERRLHRDAMVKAMTKPSADITVPVEIRKISLKKIEAALRDAVQNGLGVIPDEVRFLAGIQRIQYVLVYPEENDIVIAGPGEGWKVDDDGNVVGVTTGLPTVRLDDFIVALRSTEAARRGGITCSIDPTPEGLKQFDAVVKQAGGRMQPGVVDALEKAMGPQKITVTGVPDGSHFARVLVAADYRMKRYAMELDPSPVKDLPSFTGMLKTKRGALNNMLPRWWLACNYEPLVKSPDGLAWEIRGPGVKAMTETDFVAADGTRTQTGKADPVAQQWADKFTAKYGELSTKDGVFGELRNLMDLSVAAALIHREDMLNRVGLQLPVMLTEKEALQLEPFAAPKTVSSKCSVTKISGGYIVTASGGVEINSWQIVEKTKEDAAIKEVREKAEAKTAKSWWWN